MATTIGDAWMSCYVAAANLIAQDEEARSKPQEDLVSDVFNLAKTLLFKFEPEMSKLGGWASTPSAGQIAVVRANVPAGDSNTITTAMRGRTFSRSNLPAETSALPTDTR